MARLSVSLLGTFQATLDGEPVAGFESAKVRALLAYLIVESGAPHHRETLAGLLWPERPERAARNNLRHALSVLRTAIGDRNAAHTERGTPPFLLITRETIQFNRAGDVWLDVAAFRTLAEVRSESHASCRHLEEAVAIYRGSFLEGFSVKGSPAFEEWSLLVRDRLQRQASMALLRLVGVYEARGEIASACRYARRQVELEPWHEEAHRRLMRLLALSGRRSAALVQYEACRRALRDELDVEPGKETVRLYEHIRDGELTPATAPSTPSSLSTGDPALSHAATRKATRKQRERRTVTALAALVVTSTPQGDPIDVETRVEMVNHVCRVLSHEIEGYGGEVDRYRDDGLVALFGASAAHEDDPERAVLAALEIQQALEHSITEWVQGEEIALSLRVGIHTGQVIAAPIGDRAQYWDASATSSALALAAAASGTAPAETVPVTIWVAEDTWSLVAALFEWEHVDGRGTAAVAYRPLARRLTHGKGRGVEGLASPLVGRELEAQVLQDVVTRLREGVGGIVTLIGEAGIGKSRLMAEIKRAALHPWLPPESADLRWIEGRCLSYATNIAYHLWQDVLQKLLAPLDIALDPPPATVRDALREGVEALCPNDQDDVYPYLARLMSLPLKEETQAMMRGLDAESLQFITFGAVETILERAAALHPLVIVCEDLHWADPTSLALLERLMPLVERAPLLFVCLLRPEIERGCWALRGAAVQNYPHCHTDLWLKPLTTTESAALIGNLLHIDDIPRALCARILERAEGNPFYVEEILRALIANGTLVHDDLSGHWEAARIASDLPIPDTLHGVIAARIDRLPGEAKHVLQVASVIGRIFSYPVLSAVVQSGPRPVEEGARALDAHLLTLQRAQLIHARARLPAREYAFKHVLTQEAAYSGLLRRERRAIHRRVAEALERLYPERIEEQLGLLAYHWERAGETIKAVEYLHRVGVQAAAQHANDEAIGYLSRAIELTPKSDPDRRYVLLLAREGVYDVQGAREVQRQDLSALEALAADLDEGVRRAEIAHRKAQYAYAIADCPASIAAAREAVALAQAVGDVARETAAHLQWGITLRRMNDHAAAAFRLEHALALARHASLRSVHSTLEADALRALGMVRGYQGQLAMAKTYMQRALELCRQAADVKAEGLVLAHLAVWHTNVGDYVAARSYGEQALGIFAKIGFRWGQGEVLWSLGFSSFSLGDYAQARSYLEQELQIGRETRNPSRESRALTDLGWLAHCQGDHETAQAYSRRGLALAEGCGNQWYQAVALVVLGHALAGLEQTVEAIDCYRRALTLLGEMHLLRYSLDVRAGLARIALIRREYAEALTYVQQILDHRSRYPKLECLWEPLRAYLTCTQVLRAVDDPRADEVLEAAYRLLQERAATIEDEGLRRAYLENVPYHREIVTLWKKQDRLSTSQAKC